MSDVNRFAPLASLADDDDEVRSKGICCSWTCCLEQFAIQRPYAATLNSFKTALKTFMFSLVY